MSESQNRANLNQLKDMFFYTFGIVPLQNYGVIGDGITDNRIQIQQAIYDAIDVGAKYIFVPKGEFYYHGNLFKTEEVIFVGNNVDASIRNVEIRQFPDLWNEAQATSASLVPIAGIVIYASNEIPENYLECNGQSVKTTDYLSLYAKLNNIDVNEETELPETFKVPNISIETYKYIIRAK